MCQVFQLRLLSAKKQKLHWKSNFTLDTHNNELKAILIFLHKNKKLVKEMEDF